MKGKLLTNKELKALPDGASVHIVAEPQSQKDEPLDRRMYIEHAGHRCYLHPEKKSIFCMDFTYGEDDDFCVEDGLEVYEYIKRSRKPRK